MSSNAASGGVQVPWPHFWLARSFPSGLCGSCCSGLFSEGVLAAVPAASNCPLQLHQRLSTIRLAYSLLARWSKCCLQPNGLGITRRPVIGRPGACPRQVAARRSATRQTAKNSRYIRSDLQSFVLARIARRGGRRTYNAHLGKPAKPPIMRSRVAEAPVHSPRDRRNRRKDSSLHPSATVS